MKQVFRIKNSLLVVAIAAAYPLASHGAAGVAQFTSGDVQLKRGAGSDTLIKGKNVESGDSIVTGENGRAQVRFSDGGLVALAPNSQFNITRYADANNPAQDSFLVDLLRGGMRAVTGLIGKRNRDNYKVTTQTATIGIRGSAFSLAYGPNGQLLVSTQMDAIEVCTRAGCVGLTAGESAVVTSNDVLATRTNAQTSISTPPPAQKPEVASNQVTGDGKASIIPDTHTNTPQEPPPKGPKVYTGMAMAYSGIPATGSGNQPTSIIGGEGTVQNAVYAGAVQTDVNGHPEQFQSTNNFNLTRDGTATIVSETGTYEAGDLMVLGTWQKAKATSTNSQPAVVEDGSYSYDMTPFAFVTGVATASDSLAQMAGLRGEYSLASKTDVFVSDGTKGTLLDSSKLSVSFTGRAAAIVDVYLDILVPNSLGMGAHTYDLRGQLGAADGQFGGSVYCDSGSYNDYCGGHVTGFFGAAQAKKIGVSYSGYREYRSYNSETEEYGNWVSESLGGAAAFKQDTVTNLPEMSYSMAASVAYSNASGYGASPFAVGSYTSTVSMAFVGNGLTKIPYSIEKASGSTFAYDSSASYSNENRPDGEGFIGWGYWSAGTKYYGTAVKDVHYIVGKPSSYMPYSGTGTYTAVGHTTPTSTNGGSGTLTAASLTANFGSMLVDASATAKFGTTEVSVAKTGIPIYGAQFSGSNSSGSINGMFTGYYADRAGFVYSTNHGTLGAVSGAVAFRQTGITNPTD